MRFFLHHLADQLPNAYFFEFLLDEAAPDQNVEKNFIHRTSPIVVDAPTSLYYSIIIKKVNKTALTVRVVAWRARELCSLALSLLYFGFFSLLGFGFFSTVNVPVVSLDRPLIGCTQPFRPSELCALHTSRPCCLDIRRGSTAPLSPCCLSDISLYLLLCTNWTNHIKAQLCTTVKHLFYLYLDITWWF